MKSYIWVIMVASLLIPHQLLSQEHVEIKDPNLTLTFDLPQGWIYLDDGYNLRIFKEDTTSSNYLNVTYFSDNEKVSLDTLLYIEKEILLPEKLQNFDAVVDGNTQINSTDAKWFRYNFTENNLRKTALLFLSIQQQQRVMVTAYANKDDFDVLLNDFKKIGKSVVLKTP